ncbi:CATRA system-associated protein [Streptomyces sp. NPDC057877]|uniref:CATRA system-associated protein n=1 Tax=Streptomyces sp. NPDC057877 TaxID=3346269 RepID=UPI00367772F0
MPPPHAFSPRSPAGDARAALAKRILTLLERSLTVWELPAETWKGLDDGPLDALLATGADSDAPALRRALVELDLVTPGRITPVTTTAPVPAPDRHRERVNHLVHALREILDGSTADRAPHPADGPRDTDPTGRR